MKSFYCSSCICTNMTDIVAIATTGGFDGY
jgi:hypothetical protein